MKNEIKNIRRCFVCQNDEAKNESYEKSKNSDDIDSVGEFIEKNICKIKDKYSDYKNYLKLYAEKAEKLLKSLVRSTEGLALNMREYFAIASTSPNPQAELEDIENEIFEIKVELTPEGFVRITMPALVHKECGYQWYIRFPLHIKLREFTSEMREKGKNINLENAVIVYKHCCTKAVKYDNDNYEKNAVTDELGTFFLPDDGSKYCSFYEYSVVAESSKTEIYVVPQSDFCDWYRKYL